eukprot:scaffold94115_cov48-Attheya_sp.AAC.4
MDKCFLKAWHKVEYLQQPACFEMKLSQCAQRSYFVLFSVSSVFLYFCGKVLELLSKAVNECGIKTIAPNRSQGFEVALSGAPYRTFLGNPATEKTAASSLLLYCLPTSVTEYLGFASEASLVRSKILSFTDEPLVVAIFDPTTNAFVGGSAADILATISGSSSKNNFAAASLGALAQLDALAAAQLGSSGRSDVVIVVGAGGREHAIAVALAQSPLISKIICCPGNGGTAVEGGKISNAEGVNGKQDNGTVISLVKRVGAHMVVVGPEAPLVDGLVDELK